jgi:hypothetical protein
MLEGAAIDGDSGFRGHGPDQKLADLTRE